MLLRPVLIITLLIVGIAGTAGAKDFWGHKLLDQPTQFIFGYGSLIDSASRNSTAAKPIPAIPVRVSAVFGYIRTWNDRSPSGFTALGLRRPGPHANAMTINGVLYPVEGNDMSAFDAREKGYLRIEVPRRDMEPSPGKVCRPKGKSGSISRIARGENPGSICRHPMPSILCFNHTST